MEANMWNNWAILLLKWSDDDMEPFPRSYAEQMFTGAGKGTRNIVDFYDAISHGRLDLSGSKVFGWWPVDHSIADYHQKIADGEIRTTLLSGWAKDAAAAFHKDEEVAAFDGMILVFSRSIGHFGGNRFAVIGYDPASLHYRSVDLAGASHELGHAYNMEHSRRDGSSDDYGDKWDMMSTYSTHYANPDTVPATTQRPYHSFGPGLNAVNMAIMTWLDETRVYAPRPGGSKAKVLLRPLHRRDLPGWLAVQLGSVYVEFRVNDRWDAAFPAAVVLLHHRGSDPINGMACSYLIPGKRPGGALVQALDVGDYWESSLAQSPNVYIKVQVRRIDPVKQQAELEIAYQPLEVSLRRPPGVPAEVWGVLIGGSAVGAGGYFWIPGKDLVPLPPNSPLLNIMEKFAAVQQIQDGHDRPDDVVAATELVLIEVRNAVNRLITKRREPRVPGLHLTKRRRR
jgi:hypothetical protein